MKQQTVTAYPLISCVIITLIGTFFVSLGIRLIVLGNLGADALSTFILGLLNFVSAQFGTVSLTINILILILAFFKERQMIGLASIINSFGIGLFLNLFDYLGIFQSIPSGTNLLMTILGPLSFAFGTALYLLTNRGSGAYECLMMMVKQQFHWSVRTARIVIDASFMAIGFLLGGPIGIGTVIVLVLLGPALDFFLKFIPKLAPDFFQRFQQA